MAGETPTATISAAGVPVGPLAHVNLAVHRSTASIRSKGETMSEEQRQQENDDVQDFNEDGPGINSSAGSWLYVVGGIPMMILFFVVLFTVVGSCDAQNIMING